MDRARRRRPAELAGSKLKVIGICGWSGSGKTTLIARLLPRLTAQGLRVSTIKHAHHSFDVDTPGKDSHTHRLAGAQEVLVCSDQRWALMHELRGAPEPSLPALLARLSPVDLVIVEGFKRHRHRKLEVHRAATGKTVLAREDADIVGVASDVPLPNVAVPVLHLDDMAALAAFVLAEAGG